MSTVKTYKLVTPHFLSPTWLNLFRGGAQAGEVDPEGAVDVHGQVKLSLLVVLDFPVEVLP